MVRLSSLPCLVVALALLPSQLRPADEDFVFRSDVALIRVDAQVVDRSNRAITGLTAADFLLYEQDRQQEVRNFAQEDMPLDILLLLDVSGSMRPHVERIASASRHALLALGNEDRVGIMVFDRGTRLRLPFRESKQEVENELRRLLNYETFDGGTDINRGLTDAVTYVARSGRTEARRAIVILTDDQSERGTNEAAINRALASSNIVLSALIAPDVMGSRPVWRRGGGGGWPGPSIGGPLGGIILGRRGPMGGGSPPVIMGPRVQSAGTAEIARRSGGDSMNVDRASALEDTLARLRQRYALHFHLPPGVNAGEEREIEVALSKEALRRHPGAQVRFRRSYISPTTTEDTGMEEPVVISQAPPVATTTEEQEPETTRRRGVSERIGGSVRPSIVPTPQQSSGGWKRAEEQEQVAQPEDEPAKTEGQPRRGWRKLKPGEKP